MGQVTWCLSNAHIKDLNFFFVGMVFYKRFGSKFHMGSKLIRNMSSDLFKVGSCLIYVKHHMGLNEDTNCIFVNTDSISNGFFNCWWCTQIVLYAMLSSIHVGRSGCHLTTILTSHGWHVVDKLTKSLQTLWVSINGHWTNFSIPLSSHGPTI